MENEFFNPHKAEVGEGAFVLFLFSLKVTLTVIISLNVLKNNKYHKKYLLFSVFFPSKVHMVTAVSTVSTVTII